MKKILSYTSALLLLVGITTACSNEKDLYQAPTEEGNTEEVNTFNFSTVTTPEIQVSYKNIGYGSYTTSVYFEVYTENPIIEGEEGTITRKEGVNPVFNAYTKADGTWSGKIELPAYTKEVYVYSPSFFAQTLMSAEVNGAATIILSDANYKTVKAVRTLQNGSAPYRTSAVETDGWKTWLGAYSTSGMDQTVTDYNKYSGGIAYADQFYSNEDKEILNIDAAGH